MTLVAPKSEKRNFSDTVRASGPCFMAVESATSITLLAETDVAKNGKAAEDDGTERDGRTGRTTTKKAPFLRRLCPPSLSQLRTF